MLFRSDVVVTFSKMIEGWNRIAHEALLCGTPVVGSGVGGMKELLDGAGQLIAGTENDLAQAVGEVLSRKKEFVECGQPYVRQFTMDYFRNAWVGAMESLIGK